MRRHLGAIRSLFVCAGLAAVISGCGDAGTHQAPPTDPPPTTPPTGLTYYRDIKPVTDRYCAGCHTTGGITPFVLTDYESVRSHAAMITTAVNSGRMPPWLPDDSSMAMHYSRELRPQDKQQLLDWLAAGAPAGDPSSPPRTDIPVTETVTPPRADLTLQGPDVYQPVVGSSDDYHCFVFDPKLDRDRYLTAGQVNPDNGSIVHHVVLYLIPAAQAAQIQKLDPTGKGYTCFGGAGGNVNAGILLAWAPGSTPMRTPDGTSFKVPKGALVVMQVHYNLIADNGRGDRTSVVAELTDTPPTHEIKNLIIVQPGLNIKAGDANSHQGVNAPLSSFSSASALTVYGVFPHMHLLGTQIAVSAGSQKIVEIPRWDFHWQQTYLFQQPFTLHASDVMNLSCVYDNSAANQPVVMGKQQQPRDVHWGESTLDEMCVALFWVSAQ